MPAPMSLRPPIHDEEALIDRIENDVRTRPQQLVFLVGSALAMPSARGESGVPGVAGVVELIREELGPGAADKLAEALARERNGYQAAFRFLSGRRSPEVANRIIRRAVLQARQAPPPADVERQLMAADEAAAAAACRGLELDDRGWGIPRGAEALGRLLVEGQEHLGNLVLTTNFDPLLEIAIARAGGQWRATPLPGDGSIDQSHGPGVHVVHLHGYWHGVDTLHTPTQLEAPRRTLKASLQRLLQSRTVVVIGYGGWDDAFTAALHELVEVDPLARPNVLWSFYEPDDHTIEDRHQHVFERVRAARDRVVFYRGIDVNTIFESLRQRLAPSRGKGRPLPPSPFVVGPPVDRDEGFFGRRRQCDELHAALYGGHSLQILGERRMGKSSLLRWAQRHAPPDRNAVFVDAQGSAGWSPADFVLAIATALRRRTEAEARLRDDAARGPLRALESLPPLLLLVDEADVLVEPRRGFDADFFNLMRALGQDGRIAWVSASRRNLREIIEETKLTSPFLNDAGTIWAGALERPAAVALLERGRPLDATLVLEETGGVAYAVQWWADAQWKAPESTDFCEALRHAMAQVFRSWWRAMTGPERVLLRRGCKDPLPMGTLGPRDRSLATILQDRGLLDGREGAFCTRGAAWRRFVDDQGHVAR